MRPARRQLLLAGDCRAVTEHRRMFHQGFDRRFFLYHFEDFIAKQLFKLTGIRRWADPEGGMVVKAAIGGQHMQMGIEILKINKTLDGNGRAGFGIVIGYGLR